MALHSGTVNPSHDARHRALRDAETKADRLFAEASARNLIRPGISEKTLNTEVYELAFELFGIRKYWHKRIIRSGPNTLQPYQENPPDRAMTDDDIVFADFGPIFDGWEGDFGRTWVIGDDPVKHRLRDDLATIFDAGKKFFQARVDVTGEELYAEVVRLTTERGWEFGNFHCGHLVGEFPHENFDGERIELPEELRGAPPGQVIVIFEDVQDADDRALWLKAQEAAFTKAWDNPEDEVYDRM